MPARKSPPEITEELSFEDALRELEAVVASLENGQVPLQKSLELLGRANELSRRCDQVLNEAQLKLEQITLTDEGELTSEEVGLEEE